MKAKHIAACFAAGAALFAVPAFADECTATGLHASSASKPISHDAPAVHAMAAKSAKRDMPDVGGADAYKTQSGKRDTRDDSIDAWFRGG